MFLGWNENTSRIADSSYLQWRSSIEDTIVLTIILRYYHHRNHQLRRQLVAVQSVRSQFVVKMHIIVTARLEMMMTMI